MKRHLTLLIVICALISPKLYAVDLNSVYTQKPLDTEAFYFTPENYNIVADGKMDVSDALQAAINQVKKERNFGILFIPEGKYKITKTIYIPGAVRLIGYGAKRPEIILAKNSPGFQNEVPSDKGKANYMFWFTGGIVEKGQNPRDAGAGTFYSAMSNINLRIEDGNPHAVALRTHYAQHSFVSNMAIYIGKGKAGLFDVGNEMENLAFYGGDYGIYTTKASPGWQVMMVDSYFEGQRIAALRCQESGLAMVNLYAKNVPAVFDIDPNYCDRLFLENSYFENVKAAVVITNENNSNNQITFRNVVCKNVPVVAHYTRSNTYTKVEDKVYKINSYDHGLQMESLTDRPRYKTTINTEALKKFPEKTAQLRDIPALPAMSTWVNLKDLGAKGDDTTDDTKAIQAAIDTYETIYVPQGWYKITETLKMKPNTKLIGLHPFGTQFRLDESSKNFSGFGSPVAMLESSKENNILNGIGINTGGYNYRAVGVKWMANEDSYMNDVKFVGGHGGMNKPNPNPQPAQARPRNNTPRISSPSNPIANSGMDQAWDNQHWSLWITNGGGGTFKDIWTASTYATNGIYVSHTSTPGRIYAMSIEHHVRNEVRFNKVSNWKVYCMQTEEESRESTECQPLEMDDCDNIRFANLYMFRVIRVNEPYHSSVRIRNCANIEFLNLHNFAQTKYTNDVSVYDASKDIEVRPWELSRLIVTGKEVRPKAISKELGVVNTLARDFEFAEGIAKDSKGNIYFCDHRFRRIYKWSADNKLSLIADFPWKPSNLAVDTEDNLLVVFRYDPQPGTGEKVMSLPDLGGTSFSGWGNNTYNMLAYSIDPNNPEESIKLLDRVPLNSVNKVVKALHPSNRWRDFHDFNSVSTSKPEYCFLAPDGVTIIPHFYDIARSSQLLEAYPGKTFYLADEYDRRMVRYDVDSKGLLGNLTYFVEQGEFGSAVDSEGNLYVADGDIYVFDKDGKEINYISVPERPSTLTISGNTLYITGRSQIFSVRVK